MTRLWDLDTPSLLIEQSVLETNLATMQALADRCGIALRPHAKTHKIPAIALRQQALGAVGIAVAKLGEAEVFAEAGLGDIQIANQIVGEAKLERLRRLHRTVRVSCAVDHVAQVEALSAAFAGETKPLPLLVEVDTGLHRCGVRSDEEALSLATFLQSKPGLAFEGFLTHAGQVYGAQTVGDIARMASEEGRRMAALAEKARSLGYPVSTVSVGSTPGAAFCAPVPGVTELRAGNYVFHDRIQQRLGVVSAERLALSVLATVISTPEAGLAVVDAGSKSLSLDQGAHGNDGLRDFGAVRRVYGKDGTAVSLVEEMPVIRVSEEHGVVADPQGRLRIGQKVRIWVNHACAVMNLHEEVYLMDGETVLERWPVAARGAIR